MLSAPLRRAPLRFTVLILLALALAGCGSAHGGRATASRAAASGATAPGATASGATASGATTTATTTADGPIPQARPQVVEPSPGVAAAAVSVTPSDPVGDVNAHAPPLSEVQKELKQELVAVKVSDASYINPLHYVTHWERTDQGVDANMPVGAPIVAPTQIKILAIEPGWYAGQPLVYWELLAGADAGKVQYVAEEITDIARPGSILQQGQVIARYAASGTGIEFGWSTPSGVTLAVATSGYEEGQVTPAGVSIRQWLNSLGANAGNG